MDEKNGQIAHRRTGAGWGILRNLGKNNNSPATGPLEAMGEELETRVRTFSPWEKLFKEETKKRGR